MYFERVVTVVLPYGESPRGQISAPLFWTAFAHLQVNRTHDGEARAVALGIPPESASYVVGPLLQEQEATALQTWVETVGLPWLSSELARGEYDPRSREPIEHREGGFVLVASSHGRLGILSLGAWRE